MSIDFSEYEKEEEGIISKPYRIWAYKREEISYGLKGTNNKFDYIFGFFIISFRKDVKFCIGMIFLRIYNIIIAVNSNTLISFLEIWFRMYIN